jgi:hypothetical protein
MNANQQEKLVTSTDRNRAPSVGDTANSDELKDDLKKIRTRARVGGAILRGETMQPSGATVPAALNSAAMKEELAADSGIASPQVTAITFLTLILSGFFALCCEARVYDSDGSEASVQACIRSAADGDIVTIPAGTFTWTSALNITKGITLQGQTAITGAGTANPVIKDLTIVRDDTPRSGKRAYMLAARMSTGSQSFRLTGITFTAGSFAYSPSPSTPIRLSSEVENKLMRVDHCHFDQLYQGRCIWANDHCWGVADHNVFKGRSGLGTTQVFLIQHANFGNETWADYPWYGTDKFFFIEDNTVTGFINVTDSDTGGKFVVRHNYLINAVIVDHGTEGGVRGCRAKEVYNNTIDMTVAGKGGQRSGSSLWHDNIFTGVEPTNNIICPLANYRETSTRAHPVWGIADGTSPWDLNDTEGNGTYVEGHPPYLFASGSATSGSTITGEVATFSDSTKNWTPNQWVGYSIRNTNPGSPSHRLGSYIISNTSNTITYAYNNAPNGGHLIFNAGDTYEIHRVLVMMDQNGRGKGDLVKDLGQPINRGKGDQTTGPRKPINTSKGDQIRAPRQPVNRGKHAQIMGAGKPPINARTGTSSWPQQALEPCYSWNNIYTPNGHSMGYGVRRGQPTTKLNVDFFNLGAGFPADSTPSQVSSRYTAALNGVDYVETFVYPHPLVSGNQRSPSATGGPTNNSQKNEKLKREKPAKKINERDN